MIATVDPEARHPIARAFVASHLAATPLPGFPGAQPETLAEAYAIQRDAIALWPEPVVGWKVARIGPDHAARLGADRLIGPVFAGSVGHAAGGGAAPFPIIAGGGGALEAEIMLVLATDAPARATPWTPDAARRLIGRVHVGIEAAGSAFAGNSALGPTALICGLGNTLGLIVGPEVPDWRDRDAPVACRCTIDGEAVGSGSVDAGLSGPLAALALALEIAAANGLPLRAGQIVSTGAITGVHPLRIGQSGVADFGEIGRIACQAVAAAGRQAHPRLHPSRALESMT